MVAVAPELDEVELRRVAREAHGLMQSDPAAAHTLLGGVASQRGDSAASERHHTIAMSIDPNPTWRCNYAISLCHLGLYEEALGVVNVGLRTHPDDIELLDQGITAAFESANFIAACELVHRCNALHPKRRHSKSDMVEQLAAATDRGLFKERNVRSVLGIAGAVPRDARVRVAASSISVSPLEPDSFFYQRAVFASPKSTSALNWAFADRIANRPDLIKDPGPRFLVGFTGATANGSHS